MIGQMTIWDMMPAEEEVALDPLREVALMASPYWTTSWEDLTEMLAEEPTSTEWVQAVKKEFCPYGFAGHYGADGPVPEYTMKNGYIELATTLDGKRRCYKWSEFAERVRELIQEGERGSARMNRRIKT